MLSAFREPNWTEPGPAPAPGALREIVQSASGRSRAVLVRSPPRGRVPAGAPEEPQTTLNAAASAAPAVSLSPPSGSLPPAISVTGLVKRYRKADRNAVDGISFEVRHGEFFALLGPNGAGKTTTLSILTTTLAPTDGEALVDGYDVVADAATVRRRVGIIFQKPSLDRNLTGEENVRLHAILYGLYPYAPAYRLMAAAYRRQVGEWSELLGLGREIFDPVRTYSGGMLRKLEIVRSLVHRPSVLFLDEPTTGLDAPSRRSLWGYLSDVRLEHGTTIVLTSHYLEEAEQADRICIVDHGRIVATGAPADLTAALASEWLVVDADDRGRLRDELVRLRHAPSGDGPFRLDVRTRDMHAVLRSIETPLTVVRTHAPSLEDAYLEIVSRAELADA
jgi:ABC-2 type transport system ATP-binding protein